MALYKYDACPYCSKVARAATRLGVPLPDLRDIRTDPAWRADLVRRTGGGQVPCLLIDDFPLLESDDIVAWLEAHAARTR